MGTDNDPSEIRGAQASGLHGRAAKKQLERAEKQAARKAKAAANAELEKSMPEVSRLLRQIGFAPDQRLAWLEYLRSANLDESEVLTIVAPPPSAKTRALNARMIVARHGIRRLLRGRDFVPRLLYTAGWLYLLIASAGKLHWGLWAILSVLTVVVAKTRFVIRDMRPKNMQLVDRGYNERKLLLQRLIEATQRWRQTQPSSAEVDQYRRDALTLLAGYVRDHRARFGSREILAALLVQRGDEIVVLARSDGLRPVPVTYTKEQCALVASAIESGEARVTGDVYSDFPKTVPGKRYNSILALPIWFQGAVIGAVSIDSQEKYHFHLDFDDLQVHLAPYVQLLAVTL